jgi:hypothetical protein
MEMRVDAKHRVHRQTAPTSSTTALERGNSSALTARCIAGRSVRKDHRRLHLRECPGVSCTIPPLFHRWHVNCFNNSSPALGVTSWLSFF